MDDYTIAKKISGYLLIFILALVWIFKVSIFNEKQKNDINSSYIVIMAVSLLALIGIYLQ
jgi:hypothetical protein